MKKISLLFALLVLVSVFNVSCSNSSSKKMDSKVWVTLTSNGDVIAVPKGTIFRTEEVDHLVSILDGSKIFLRNEEYQTTREPAILFLNKEGSIQLPVSLTPYEMTKNCFATANTTDLVKTLKKGEKAAIENGNFVRGSNWVCIDPSIPKWLSEIFPQKTKILSITFFTSDVKIQALEDTLYSKSIKNFNTIIPNTKSYVDFNLRNFPPVGKITYKEVQ